jgi:hypothetical protein
MFTVGQMVETAVYVGRDRVPMSKGRIVAVHSGYCDVDVMSHHGGAPWIQSYPKFALRAVERTTENGGG